ncbi:MAG: terpene cyclase/mutase family protein [Planctomycetota bacterium]|nr:terpene cyclase/mutase family protein [Planctomycetota bacterium]
MAHARRVLWIVMLVLAAPGQAAGEDAEKSDGFQELLPKQDEAIERALAWLAKNQARDGSWNAGAQGYPCAMTGMAGLAFLAAGQTPARGKYGPQLTRAIEYLLKQQDRSGHIGSTTDGRSMYGHGFAMTFLAECYGMEPGTEFGGRIKDCLDKAIVLVSKAQSSQGGWYYSPNSGTDEGSVTITQVQALRACANVGLNVPDRTLQRAIDYIKKSQQPDGGVAYRVGMSGSRPALSAAGAELLLMAGMYNAPETKKAIEYVKRHVNADNSRNQHDSYTTFYAAQALHQIGGDDWVKYFGERRRRYLKEQNADGSWSSPGWGASPVFDTSVGVIVLALPYQYLPLYQR